MSAAATPAPVGLCSTRYQIVNEVEVREERRVLAPILPRELIHIVNSYRDTTREGEMREEKGGVMERWVAYVMRPNAEFFEAALMTDLFQLAISGQPQLKTDRAKFQFVMRQIQQVETYFNNADFLGLARPHPKEPAPPGSDLWAQAIVVLCRVAGCRMPQSTLTLQDEKGNFLKGG